MVKWEEEAAKAEESATSAEETAAAAMQRAGGAVRDEMEAAAVVKETQHALAKALQGLRDLGPKEDQAAQDAARCRSLHHSHFRTDHNRLSAVSAVVVASLCAP